MAIQNLRARDVTLLTGLASRVARNRVLVILGAVALICLAILRAVLSLHVQLSQPYATDFYSYYGAALDLRAARDPYQGLTLAIQHYRHGGAVPFSLVGPGSNVHEFSYGPLLGVVIIPFTWLPFGVALRLWDCALLVLLIAAILVFLQAARVRVSTFRFVLLASATLLIAPLRFELYYAQGDALLLFLVCTALWARLREHPLLAGFLLAGAISCDPVLVVALLLLAWKREWQMIRAAFLFTVILLGALVAWLGIATVPHLFTIWSYYASQYSRTFSNDAPYGLLSRLLTSGGEIRPIVNAPGLIVPLWLTLSAVCLWSACRHTSRRWLANDTRSLLDVGLSSALLLVICPWVENGQFLWLLLAFLAVFIYWKRTEASSSTKSRIGMLLLCSFALYIGLGDTVQYALHARWLGSYPVVYLYVVLGAIYLYPLAAIVGTTIYAQRHIDHAISLQLMDDDVVPPNQSVSPSVAHHAT